MALDPGKSRTQLLSYISQAANILNRRYQGFLIARPMACFCLLRALRGKNKPSKPCLINLIPPFVVIPTWLTKRSNYLVPSPRNMVCRNWIFTVAKVVPVPSVEVLKSFIIYRNSSGLPLLNVLTFSSWVLDVADDGSRRILILIMLHYSTFSTAAPIRRICGD